jgi:hypothetical protein
MTRRNVLISAGVLAVVVGAICLWVRYSEFWSIDACVDRGGAWDYSAKECRH